ncbi:hypothetical protein Hanom_Chr10g00951451 [Helianthus anomalus]
MDDDDDDDAEARVITGAPVTLTLQPVNGTENLRGVDRRSEAAVVTERVTVDDRRVVRLEGRVVEKNAIDPLLIAFPPLLSPFSH